MRMILMASSRLLNSYASLRSIVSHQRTQTYASARRFIARLAYEIFDQPANTVLANYN
jgi:hypothetical protein